MDITGKWLVLELIDDRTLTVLGVKAWFLSNGDTSMLDVCIDGEPMTIPWHAVVTLRVVPRPDTT